MLLIQSLEIRISHFKDKFGLNPVNDLPMLNRCDKCQPYNVQICDLIEG